MGKILNTSARRVQLEYARKKVEMLRTTSL